MDDLAIARAVHVLAIVHWIGGVSMVTLVLLPGLSRAVKAAERMSLFGNIEGRFGNQARISTALAGLSGLYMVYGMDVWDRFADPSYWWMHAMVLVWAIFTFMLFVAEPFFLHRWFDARAARDPEGTFRRVQRMHVVLLTLSAITVAGAVLGAHGAFL